eukprot:CAMPEP_0206323228 /NCGR_PEP_ID=MMETSP0106_2-20121207/19858_1 /ASSEMBLY_ACC=CAM_ASM_000206 /TAXON_ID=81532 /ORGANISM="Acanthoeca-like sp., Strain 10tr" /LENGTH=91 /DNA_ID=CAMNT_0053755475 /DNA_START=88 /DNA_END=364 /DNA_ORIENTATION=+
MPSAMAARRWHRHAGVILGPPLPLHAAAAAANAGCVGERPLSTPVMKLPLLVLCIVTSSLSPEGSSADYPAHNVHERVDVATQLSPPQMLP